MKFLIAFLLFSLLSCNTVRVKTHIGFMGPNVYEVYGSGISVRYYNGNCCCVAKEVLQAIAKDANGGLLDWDKMKDKDFQDKILEEYCQKIKKLEE